MEGKEEQDILDPRKQFSKRLARYGAIVWGIFLLAIVATLNLQPETAVACVYLTLIVTGNKMMDTWAYTKNSTYEKGLRNLLERTKLELTLGSGIGGRKKETEESEEGGNG